MELFSEIYCYSYIQIWFSNLKCNAFEKNGMLSETAFCDLACLLERGFRTSGRNRGKKQGKNKNKPTKSKRKIAENGTTSSETGFGGGGAFPYL